MLVRVFWVFVVFYGFGVVGRFLKVADLVVVYARRFNDGEFPGAP